MSKVCRKSQGTVMQFLRAPGSGRYWAVVSPGVELIRRQSLRIVKADAEARFRTIAQGRLSVQERAN